MTRGSSLSCIKLYLHILPISVVHNEHSSESWDHLSAAMAELKALSEIKDNSLQLNMVKGVSSQMENNVGMDLPHLQGRN